MPTEGGHRASPPGRRLLLASHHLALILLSAGGAVLAFHGLQLAFGPFPQAGPRFREFRPLMIAVYAVLTLAGSAAALRAAHAWCTGRWNEASWAPFRILLYLVVLGSLAFVVFLQPYWELYLELAAGLVLGAFGPLAVFGPSWARRLPRRALDLLDKALLAACLLATGLEAGLRTLAWLRPSPLLARADPSAAEHLARRRLAPGSVRYGFAADERGWNDERPRPRGEGDVLICSIADSFALGTTHHAFHFTTVCEEALPWCQIYNMGAPETGPREYAYILANEVPREAPDAVLIGLCLGNDVTDSVATSHAEEPLRRYFDRDNLLLAQVASRLPRYWQVQRALRSSGRAVGEVQGLRLERPQALTREALHLQAPWYVDPFLEQPTMTESAYVEAVTWRALKNCGRERVSYEPLFAYLREMRRLCGATPMYVLLFPDEWQVEQALWDAVVARSEGEVRDRFVLQETVSAWLESEGFAYLDLLPVLQAVPPLEDGDRHLYHRFDTHWNRRGNEAVGRALAEYLGPRLRP